jgi:hypothetical protein
MNPMNEQRFFDLTMKVIARQASEAERAELEALTAGQPELKAEWERLQADSRLAQTLIPLSEAAAATAGELPGYARQRLQSKVRHTLGQPTAEERKWSWNWRWMLAPALATAVVLFLFVLPWLQSSGPIIQVALLDTAGASRGGETNEIAVLNQQWNKAAVQSFERISELEAWEKQWASRRQPEFKVIYDRSAGEVRVLGHCHGRVVEKTFPVERTLAEALKSVAAFIRDEVNR